MQKRHKTWLIIIAAIFGVLFALLVGFIISCIAIGTKPQFYVNDYKDGKKEFLYSNIKTGQRQVQSAGFNETLTYAELPLTPILKDLNLAYRWPDNKKIEITSKDQSYLLDFSGDKISLKNEKSNDELWVPPVGNYTYVMKYTNNELILDDTTAVNLLSKMGVRVEVEVDAENFAATVYVR